MFNAIRYMLPQIVIRDENSLQTVEDNSKTTEETEEPKNCVLYFSFNGSVISKPRDQSMHGHPLDICHGGGISPLRSTSALITPGESGWGWEWEEGHPIDN